VPTARCSKVAALTRTALTGAAQSLITAMNSNERIQRRERQEDKEDKSLIKLLWPDQQKPFHWLVTDDFVDPPYTSKFMNEVLRLQSPQHAAANQGDRLGKVPLSRLSIGTSPMASYPRKAIRQSRVDYPSYSAVQKGQAWDPPPFTRTQSMRPRIHGPGRR
jgi:hypothetical protein